MFEIYNDIDKNIDINLYNKYTKYLVKKLKLKKCIFNIIFVDNKEIHNLNKVYRKVDRETDVITFALEDNEKVKLKNRMLGDIYISIDKARSQAKEYNHSIDREICFLITHGVLHLLGYDHMNKEDEEIMFGKQRELLEKYGIKR